VALLFLSAAIALYAAGSETESGVVYQQPVLLTSVGQAADVLIMKGLAGMSGLKVEYRPGADADSLGDCRTLLLVAGGSSKGLGAAKANPDIEIKRVKRLVKAARKAKIPILVYHIGGEARRGVLSDPFNKLAAEAGEQIVVASGGDKDGFFKKIADKNKSKYISIEKSIDVVEVLKEQFGL